MRKDYSIKWSAYTALGFKPIKLDKPLVELSNDDLQHITDTATSASVFCNDESEVPAIMEYMQTTRDALQWKGDITSSPSSYENKKGKVISGFRVGFNKELSRSMGLLAFNERLAEMAR
jgi:hypothetical protein